MLELLAGGIPMRRALKNTILILLILSLTVSTALLTYLYFFASEDRNLSGQWTARLDMSKQAAVTALGWLQDIEAVSISLEELEDYMQDLSVEVQLTMEQTARFEGTFRCSVLPESYDACRQAAYEAFAAAFRMLLTRRLCMAGYLGSTDSETIEALAAETFGMSTVSYLMNCGPALLPSLEELQDRYDGSGAYEASEGVLIRQFDGGSGAVREERYIRKGITLILSEENEPVVSGASLGQNPLIYTLKQSQGQSFIF